MATLREYYETEQNDAGVTSQWECRGPRGTIASIAAKVCYDFNSNARYWAFYVPEVDDPEGVVASLLASPETQACRLTPEGDGVSYRFGFSDYSEVQSNATLVFTGRVNLYIDVTLGKERRAILTQHAASMGLSMTIKDCEYAKLRSALEKPRAFISHDSRDKDEVVRELASELTKAMCPVWYDEYSLKVGDSLRSSIEKGLKEAAKCIVVLSPSFFANDGWGKAEFDSIFTREILERGNVILPIWHNVSVKEVYDYSPRLADRLGLASNLGPKELARRLSAAINTNA